MNVTALDSVWLETPDPNGYFNL